MTLSPLKKFMLAALAWLPLCFFIWWWASNLFVMLPVFLAGKVLTWGWPEVITSVSRGLDVAGKPTMDVLTSILVTQPGPDGRSMSGFMEPSVYPLIYGYSLPLYLGLCLATPQDEERRWGHVVIGCLVIWLAQAFGLVADALKTIVMGSGPQATAAAQAAGISVELVALCYQFGYLILPTVVPAALWLGLNRPFIEALTGRRFGEPPGDNAGRSAAP
ncbi:exosortase H-associated membrane protein [Tahibacter amnicola]|uniref:Uncharacterized protein n=1 Tax=Tahibacter amnicola TaxID=2976241 RepID=A0ABY6BCN1_9GAMM|nr:exosortase H-associated membrane protein [Tahibacter amnicola]UXI67793.1 hypothetical protein N4264_24170 [Tahibacter amnicola]